MPVLFPRLRLKKPPFTPFSPASISGLALWLKADAGVTLSGSNVTGWADQSGNGKHATVYNNPPEFSAVGLNGRPTIIFSEGAESALTGAQVLGSVPCTIVCVVEFYSDQEIGVFFQQFAEADYVAAYRGFTNGFNFKQYRIYNGENLSSDNIMELNVAYQFTAIVNGANSFLFLNGTQSANDDSGGLTPEGAYFVGRWEGGSRSTDVKISEVLCYSKALSSTERQQIDSYLSVKYALY
jgi:hypothetical protein